MDVLSALKAAQEVGAGQKILPTKDGVLILEALKYVPNGFKGPRFVFEFFVESSDGPQANQPGSHVADVYVLNGDDGKVKSKLSRVKGVLNALGVDDEEIAAVFDDAQTKGGHLLRGLRVRYSAWEDTTNVQPGKSPFVVKQFTKIDHGEDGKMWAEGKAKLDAAKGV